MTSDEGRRILAQIRKIKPFVQASLTICRKQCGKRRCRCAQEGPIHEAALLTWKEGQRTRTIHVPADLRQGVAKWVEEGKRLRSLIREMSQAQRELLINKKKIR
jgi:Family of unknown function (DUF6788)